jgi:hypothetical protein
LNTIWSTQRPQTPGLPRQYRSHEGHKQSASGGRNEKGFTWKTQPVHVKLSAISLWLSERWRKITSRLFKSTVVLSLQLWPGRGGARRSIQMIGNTARISPAVKATRKDFSWDDDELES